MERDPIQDPLASDIWLLGHDDSGVACLMRVDCVDKGTVYCAAINHTGVVLCKLTVGEWRTLDCWTRQTPPTLIHKGVQQSASVVFCGCPECAGQSAAERGIPAGRN